MVAGVLAAADIAVDSGGLEALGGGRAEQQVVDPQGFQKV
jgi:hypothetical protein